MANGSSGAVVIGLVIGAVLATQAIDFGAADEGGDGVDDSPAAQSQPDGSDDSDGTEIPTRVEGGQAGPAPDGIITSTGRPGRNVALTFSTGPDPGSTPEVLDILDGHGVDATFCVCGTNARAQPELIRRIAAEGHALCDQGLGPDFDLSTRSDDRLQREIGLTLDAVTGPRRGRPSRSSGRPAVTSPPASTTTLPRTDRCRSAGASTSPTPPGPAHVRSSTP